MQQQQQHSLTRVAESGNCETAVNTARCSLEMHGIATFLNIRYHTKMLRQSLHIKT